MNYRKRTFDEPATEKDVSEFFEIVELEGWDVACEYFPNLELSPSKEEIFTLVNRKIKELREEYALTQTELAKILGITQKEYWRMEQEGVSVNILKLAQIAMFYNVSIDWFSGYHPERKPFFNDTKKTYVNGYCLAGVLEAKKNNEKLEPKGFARKLKNTALQ